MTSHESGVVSLAAVQAALVDVLAAEPAVTAAYVFGSLARGHAGPLSDIDVGLLIAEAADARRIRDRAVDELCRRLRTSRVDVISLADAPAPLRYRVVRDGLLVLRRNAASLERFIANTVLEYLDFKPVRDRAFGVVRDAILGER